MISWAKNGWERSSANAHEGRGHPLGETVVPDVGEGARSTPRLARTPWFARNATRLTPEPGGPTPTVTCGYNRLTRGALIDCGHVI